MYTLHLGNCLHELRNIPENSIDSVVCDPPYELGFMGKSWDASGIAYSVAMWQEVLRVLKPGGHLLAFSGSRTYHRMTCAVEDAGFEVRDQIMFVYGSGFPKSYNLDRERGKTICDCDQRTEQKAEREVHPLCDADVPAPVDTGERGREVLQSGLPEQGAPSTGREQLSPAEIRGGEYRMEGRSDDFQKEGQLRKHQVSEGARAHKADGAQGRLHNGTPAGDGGVVREVTSPEGSSSPRRSRSDEQQTGKPGIVAGQSKSQTGGAWPICSGCGKPVVPRGLGSALKPAHEPICVARKPLAKGLTVAANVLAHGTGALNIDGCRVAGESTRRTNTAANSYMSGDIGAVQSVGEAYETGSDLGRWPANLIHDGSDEVLALFPETGKSTGGTAKAGKFKNNYGEFAGDNPGESAGGFGDTGSAARFFYCAKTSKKDRNEGCESLPQKTGGMVSNTSGQHITRRDEGYEPKPQGNNHPTVKPTDLMRYLCRLVTPPGGTVLDPFMGSGSTGKAAVLEGFRFVGIEMDESYHTIAKARIEAACVSLFADMI